MKISVTTSGSYDRTEAWVKRMASGDIFKRLDRYGEMGRAALAGATPVDENIAATSWTYEIRHSGTGYEIVWSNTNVENGFHVAIMLQYGHGTGTGGYVRGRDYINPAIKPIFEQIERAVWQEVTRG